MIDTKKICKQFNDYVSTYYKELRNRIAHYSNIQDIFPDFLIGSKRIVALLCTDGVLLSHWTSEEDDFICEVKKISLADAILEISGGFLKFEFPSGKSFDLQIAKPKLYRGTDEKGTVIWRSQWDRIEVSSKLGLSRWEKNRAKMMAVQDVLTFVSANLMKMQDAQPSTILDRLREIIDEFKDLLERDPGEEDLQKFLFKHPVLLSPTASNVLSKHRFGSEYIADFIIQEANNEYILVEIESPSKKLFNKSGDPSASLTHAQRQVEDWREWIHNNIAYIRNSLPGISDPDCWIIMGRDNSLSSSEHKALNRKNKELSHITIMTFDDLFKRARRHLLNMKKLW